MQRCHVLHGRQHDCKRVVRLVWSSKALAEKVTHILDLLKCESLELAGRVASTRRVCCTVTPPLEAKTSIVAKSFVFVVAMTTVPR